jgi:hypothetical protein
VMFLPLHLLPRHTGEGREADGPTAGFRRFRSGKGEDPEWGFPPPVSSPV